MNRLPHWKKHDSKKSPFSRISGFTLAELIVVITILAILATLWFVAVQSYVSASRDGARLADVRNIETGMEIVATEDSKYPVPDAPTAFTGGSVVIFKQWIIGAQVAKRLRLNKVFKDPGTGKPYVYSVSNDGIYYQVAATGENSVSSTFPTAFANGTTSLVRGNYSFDPSLPSIIVSSWSVTSSWVYAKNVCFVTNGWPNGIDSCAETKGAIISKNSDSRIRAYWDMETSFSSGGLNYLQDLSGNGKHGYGTGSMAPVAWLFTNAVEGRGITFDGSWEITVPGFKLPETGTLVFLAKNSYFPDSRSSQWLIHNGSGDGNGGNEEINFGIGNGLSDEKSLSAYVGSFITNAKQWLILEKWNFPNDTWRHYSMRYSNGWTLDVFVDGVKWRSQPLSGVDFTAINDTVTLWWAFVGNPWTIFYRNWFGTMDEGKVYEWSLSDEEILQQARMAGFQ